ncbi:MAG: hypothetical protein ACRCX8_14350 [Sarcina sp.]
MKKTLEQWKIVCGRVEGLLDGKKIVTQSIMECETKGHELVAITDVRHMTYYLGEKLMEDK